MLNKRMADTFRSYNLSNSTYLGSAPCLAVCFEDMDAIKKAAGIVFSWIAPQTRLELIARSLRFGSYAAMVSSLKNASLDDPLILQMDTGYRSSFITEVFEDLLVMPDISEADFASQATALLAPGASFLHVLYLVRAGFIEQAKSNTGMRVAPSGDLVFNVHNMLALQNVPTSWSSHLEEEGCVALLDTAVGSVSFAPLEMALPLSQRIHMVAYDTGPVIYDGDGSEFASVPLRNAVFAEREQTGFRVLPRGWMFKTGADIGAHDPLWQSGGSEYQHERLKEMCSILRRQGRLYAEELVQDLSVVSEFFYIDHLAKVMGLTPAQYLWRVLQLEAAPVETVKRFPKSSVGSARLISDYKMHENPFQAVCSFPVQMRDELIEEVGHFIVPDSSGDKFWTSKARQVFCALFAYLLLRSEHSDLTYKVDFADKWDTSKPTVRMLQDTLAARMCGLGEKSELWIYSDLMKAMAVDVAMMREKRKILFLKSLNNIEAFMNSPDKTAGSILVTLHSDVEDFLKQQKISFPNA